MSQKASQPVIERLSRALRLVELHEFIELIARRESGTENLLQQRNVPRFADLNCSFFVAHGRSRYCAIPALSKRSAADQNCSVDGSTKNVPNSPRTQEYAGISNIASCRSACSLRAT